jgi:hypothetical protein
MLMLRELQERFAQAVLGRDDTVLGQHVLANGMTGGMTGARRLQVYRNNTLASLTEALAAVYPVVRRLVGEAFFGYTAREYILAHPSVSGNLHDFGGEFAAFLARFPGAAELVYLPDVARVEWAYHQVFHEADPPPLDLAALAGVSPEHYGALRFRLHPASRLLTSPYPVLRIWAVNQEGFEGDQTVDLAEGGVKLLVIRRGLEVMLEPLSEGGAHCCKPSPRSFRLRRRARRRLPPNPMLTSPRSCRTTCCGARWWDFPWTERARPRLFNHGGDPCLATQPL